MYRSRDRVHEGTYLIRFLYLWKLSGDDIRTEQRRVCGAGGVLML